MRGGLIDEPIDVIPEIVVWPRQDSRPGKIVVDKGRVPRRVDGNVDTYQDGLDDVESLGRSLLEVPQGGRLIVDIRAGRLLDQPPSRVTQPEERLAVDSDKIPPAVTNLQGGRRCMTRPRNSSDDCQQNKVSHWTCSLKLIDRLGRVLSLE